ncbi:Uncharacterised protein [Vibrio cholerae]|nr:Uncharacterised protein [Vibrio cholerae]
MHYLDKFAVAALSVLRPAQPSAHQVPLVYLLPSPLRYNQTRLNRHRNFHSEFSPH